ncbi:MdlB ABC-type multidrug transport system, ATPase and permease components [Candidatus Nanopelagicaceae bacterium]
MRKSINEIRDSSILVRSLRVLTHAERRKIYSVVVLQVLLGLLDLVGVGIVGLLGALTITGVGSKAPGNRVSAALEFLRIQDSSLQTQATILGLLAASTLILKTLVSVYFVRRVTFFLSRRGAVLSGRLISKLLSRSLIEVQNKSTQQTLYAVTSGVDAITMGVLNVAVQLSSDLSLLVIMGVGLFVVDPTIAISTFVVFAVVALVLYKLLEVRSRMLGMLQTEYMIENSEKTLEVLNAYRELVVRNRRGYYAEEIGKIRLKLANTLAEKSFMPNISKYVIEITVVLGFLAIAGIQFRLNDASHAVAVLSVFMAASTRIAPAVLRMQQGALIIRSGFGSAGPTLDMIEELQSIAPIENITNEVLIDHKNFDPSVVLKNISLKYPSRNTNALTDVSLEITPGEVVALVGSSGAGKTSLVDVILGVVTPNSGEVRINNQPPLEAISNFPGAIGYVPQDVMIMNGTLRSNISMGFPLEAATDELVQKTVRIAQLETYVNELELGLETLVGDRGAKMSGGQRQRLGIARALFTQPRLLILDEATSSLDGETEANISDAVQGLRGDVTVIIIAHRLSTIRNADAVVYLDEGKILAIGTFDEVRAAVPDFDQQASLMGL